MSNAFVLQTDLCERVEYAIVQAIENLRTRQAPNGSWVGDHSGPTFLLPMYVGLAYASERVPSGERQRGIVRHLTSVVRADGSVGKDFEDQRSSLTATILTYVALRMLGLDATEARMRRTRRVIQESGSPLFAASWGKALLCLLGLYDWEGVCPILPELWVLPERAPIHPSRLSCHFRQIHLPLAWLYGRRASIRPDSLVRKLRDELYTDRYERIEWSHYRDRVQGESDGSSRPIRHTVYQVASALDRICPPRLRRRALSRVLGHVVHEDRGIEHTTVSPMAEVLGAFVHYFHAPDGLEFQRAFDACGRYLSDSETGVRMHGYAGREVLDTAFALQALQAVIGPDDPPPFVRRAYEFLRHNQFQADFPDASHNYGRPCRGGWPRSPRTQGWACSDATAEALKCVLGFRGRLSPEIPRDLLNAAIGLLPSWQNADGGFAAYERQRGPMWLERLNSNSVFYGTAVDASSIESTSSCVQSLAAAACSGIEDSSCDVIVKSLRKSEQFLRRRQRYEGSFEGSLGVYFTYGTWCAVSGLLAAGVSPGDASIRRACRFLLSHQRSDGGWGEDGESYRQRRYIDARSPLASQTAWALSALLRARDPDLVAQDRAVEFLASTQLSDGSWTPERLVGIYHRACLINHENQRHYFPLLALAEWSYGPNLVSFG